MYRRLNRGSIVAMGILHDILAAGGSPLAEGLSSAVLRNQVFASKLLEVDFCSDSFSNYKSFDEASKLAFQETRR
eukprot:1248166-Amphidinium_carterae.3